jgi:hypothetical protein
MHCLWCWLKWTLLGGVAHNYCSLLRSKALALTLWLRLTTFVRSLHRERVYRTKNLSILSPSTGRHFRCKVHNGLKLTAAAAGAGFPGSIQTCPQAHRFSFPGVNQQGRSVDCPPRSSAEVEYGWNYTFASLNACLSCYRTTFTCKVKLMYSSNQEEQVRKLFRIRIESLSQHDCTSCQSIFSWYTSITGDKHTAVRLLPEKAFTDVRVCKQR